MKPARTPYSKASGNMHTQSGVLTNIDLSKVGDYLPSIQNRRDKSRGGEALKTTRGKTKSVKRKHATDNAASEFYLTNSNSFSWENESRENRRKMTQAA